MVDLDKLYQLALENAQRVRQFRKRRIYEELLKTIRENAGKSKTPIQLIGGLRGIGKTTMMLQLFLEIPNAFYFSADSILVRSEKLYSVIEEIYRAGHHTIFVDEIHKYPNWVEEMKNIYDDLDTQVIASGSSAASIRKGAIALGRRASDMKMRPLNFSEFFYLREGEVCTASLEDVLDKKRAIRWLAEHPKVEKYYKEYLSIGGFPIQL